MKETLLSILFCALAMSAVAQTIIYSEEFDGGIPETWTIGPGNPVGAVWQWRSSGLADSALVNGVMTRALFWGNLPPIESPSVNNGVAMFNSDVYDGGGISVGGGKYPGTQVADLISPTIDCSDFEAISLKFNQFARANANAVSTLLAVSVDGGTTWTDFPINEEVVSNGASSPDDVVIVDISSVAANQPDVKIRFTWNGRYYFWLIDDVQLIETPARNLALGDFFYPPASYAQPQSQIDTDTMAFSADVSNLGRSDVENVVLKVTVIDEQLNELFVDSTIIGVLPAFFEDSTILLENIFVPNELETGVFNIGYEVYALDGVEDFDLSDNFADENFIITESIYSKEDGNGIGGIRPGDDADYQYGNLYTTSFNAGEGLKATKAIFGAGKNDSDGPIGGDQVTIFLYKVKDEVFRDFSNFVSTSDESLETVGFASHTFADDYEAYDNIEVDLLDALSTEPGVNLEPGARYLLVASYEGNAASIFHGTDSDISYFQISTVVKTDRWFLGGFGPEESAFMRMEISMPTTSVKENQLPESALTLFPNPVKDQMTVQLNFEQPSSGLVLIGDINGRVLNMREFENIQNQTLNYDFSQYAAGTYFIRVNTAEGVKLTKFNVIR